MCSIPTVADFKQQHAISELRLGKKCTQSGFLDQQGLAPAHTGFSPLLQLLVDYVQGTRSGSFSCQLMQAPKAIVADNNYHHFAHKQLWSRKVTGYTQGHTAAE